MRRCSATDWRAAVFGLATTDLLPSVFADPLGRKAQIGGFLLMPLTALGGFLPMTGLHAL
jgi:hypothetical protein